MGARWWERGYERARPIEAPKHFFARAHSRAMWYLPPGWARLGVGYASGWVGLQSGALALASDAVALGLLATVALGRHPGRVRPRCDAASAATRAGTFAVAVAAVYACAFRRSALESAPDAAPGDDTAWPLQHAAVACALSLALLLSGELARGVATHALLVLQLLLSLAGVYSASVRLATPECAASRGVAAADVVSGLAWLVLYVAYRAGPGEGSGEGALDAEARPGAHTKLPATSYHLADTSAAAAEAAHDAAGWEARLSFSYLDPLIARGVTRQLEMGDIDPMPASAATEDWVGRFNARLRAWQRARRERAGRVAVGVPAPRRQRAVASRPRVQTERAVGRGRNERARRVVVAPRLQ